MASAVQDAAIVEHSKLEVLNNLTADRFDNGLDHSVDNVVPLCCTCNQRKAGWK
jgi:hypothetical protein